MCNNKQPTSRSIPPSSHVTHIELCGYRGRRTACMYVPIHSILSKPPRASNPTGVQSYPYNTLSLLVAVAAGSYMTMKCERTKM